MKLLIAVIAFLSAGFCLNDTAETIEEIKESPTQNVESTEQSQPNNYQNHETINYDYSQKIFSAEWAEKMKNFEPMYVYMIPIKKKGTEAFYETITKVPVNVRGAFLTEASKKDKIEFLILSPDNKLLYKNITSQCIFNFEANQPGDYIIKFRNSQADEEINVTFTLNTYQTEVLSSAHLSISEQKIDTLTHFINQINVLEDFVVSQERGQKKSKLLFLNK